MDVPSSALEAQLRLTTRRINSTPAHSPETRPVRDYTSSGGY